MLRRPPAPWSNNTVVGTSGDNTQVAVTVETFDIDAVRESTAAIRHARISLDLPTEADALLDTIEQSNDRSAVRRAAGEHYLFLTATSSGALGGALAAPLGHALSGLEPDARWPEPTSPMST